MATIASLSSSVLASPAAFAGRLGHKSSSLSTSSFNGRQLTPASPALPRIRQGSTAPKAFLGGPGCSPRGMRYGRGFYGRSAGFPCGPQVVVMPGQGVWPGAPALDPDQFEEYQKRQKEVYEQRRAAYEQRRVAWEEEAQKRRAIREKQRAFFRKQQEELCREQQKWREEYTERGQTEEPQQQQDAPTAKTETETETEVPPGSAQEEAVPEEPQAPPAYPQSDTSVLHLRNEVTGAEVTVVGTAQLSEASVADVRRTIRDASPDAVLVELDRQRYNRLVAASPEQSFMEDMLRLFLGPAIGPTPRAAGAALIGFYRMLAYRGMAPGREFKVAIEEAKRVGAKVVLGDQAIDETLRAVESAMSGREVQAFFASPLPDDILRDLATDSPMGATFGGFGVWGSLAGGPAAQQWAEQLKDRKLVRKLNAFMRRKAPALYKILIEQRNAKLVRALRHVEGKAVAVLGLSQMDGIEQEWQRLNEEARTARQAEVSAAESAASADVAPEVVEPGKEDVAPQLSVEDADVLDAPTNETQAGVSSSADSAEGDVAGDSTTASVESAGQEGGEQESFATPSDKAGSSSGSGLDSEERSEGQLNEKEKPEEQQ